MSMTMGQVPTSKLVLEAAAAAAAVVVVVVVLVLVLSCLVAIVVVSKVLLYVGIGASQAKLPLSYAEYF